MRTIKVDDKEFEIEEEEKVIGLVVDSEDLIRIISKNEKLMFEIKEKVERKIEYLFLKQMLESIQLNQLEFARCLKLGRNLKGPINLNINIKDNTSEEEDK